MSELMLDYAKKKNEKRAFSHFPEEEGGVLVNWSGGLVVDTTSTLQLVLKLYGL